MRFISDSAAYRTLATLPIMSGFITFQTFTTIPFVFTKYAHNHREYLLATTSIRLVLCTF